MLNILWVLMIAGGILFASFHGTMGKLTEVFISSSTEAVNLCIFMLGVIGVWNGMMEIAVKSGLMKRVSKAMYPFIHWLFPDIPPQHKANEYIAANMAANILGLGWAATPAGLKAMKELKKLEESNKGNISKKSYTAGNIARMSEATYDVCISCVKYFIAAAYSHQYDCLSQPVWFSKSDSGGSAGNFSNYDFNFSRNSFY